MARISHAGVLICLFQWSMIAAVPLHAQAGSAAVLRDFSAKVEEYMQAQTKWKRFMGSILVAREGKVLISRGYGLANAEWDLPNTPQTKFRLGSITKQFTSMVIMQLQQRGRLSVTDPICMYLDPCPPSWKPVTIHHLLTHTSGIPSYTNLSGYRAKMMMPTSKEEMIARFRDLPLEFRPGEAFKYDNSGYFLLGVILEKITGQSYEAAVQSQILAPLGMKDTGYDHSATILKKRASGYTPAGEDMVNARYVDMAQPYAAGSLYSTVEDLLRWDQALYTEQLLSAKALETMFTPFKDNYAYGWGVRAASPATFNRKQMAHGGGINGFSTYIARYPDEKVTVIVLCNNEAFPAQRVATDLGAILFAEKYEIPVERKVAKLDPRTYDAYIGEYQLAPNVILTVTREGDRLITQATGQSKIEIFPESETKFFPKAIEAEITFVKDAKGQVTHLILRQGGRDQPARKIR
jgi:CubicO group peptidase (beta-lactamase class C family)